MSYQYYCHCQANPNAGESKVTLIPRPSVNLVAPLLSDTYDNASQASPKTCE